MSETLAPGLLIAAPTMIDPRFEKSVILLAEANEDGALGFVINRRTPFTFSDISDELPFELAESARHEVVHYGGPVSPERGWVLYRGKPEPDDDPESVLQVDEDIRLAATLDVLARFVTHETQEPFKLLLGYAGWAPSQLETELKEGSWLPLDLDAAFVFETPTEQLWEQALKQLGLAPGGFVMGSGGSA
jgi:putative transcriptional regulator